MAPDNADPIASGDPVAFPQTGVRLGGINRNGASLTEFVLGAIGLYSVQFQVSITEAGQLGIVLGSVPLPFSAVGRSTGTSQIVGMCIVSTVEANTTLRITNFGPAAVTVTPSAGGDSSVSAHLIITRLPYQPPV